MSYGIVPNNSKGVWWCKEPCQHSDCAANRLDWEINNKCLICGKPFKAGDRFCYQEHGTNDKVHFICGLERIEATK